MILLVNLFVRTRRGEFSSRFKFISFSVTQHMGLIEVYMNNRPTQHVGYIGLNRNGSDSIR